MVKELIDRPEYLNILEKWMTQDDLVKILTGVRRCGKSSILDLFQKKLIKSHNVSSSNIISLNLENEEETKKIGLSLNAKKRLYPYDALLKYILDKLNPKEKTYLFIDEIQLLEDWQRVVNTLRIKKNTDVYITGSNAYMFSSDLANTFGGRYVEIKIQPFSFKEFYTAYTMQLKKKFPASKAENLNKYTLQSAYEAYVKIGSFPKISEFLFDLSMAMKYLMDTVYLNTLQKDIKARYPNVDTSKLDAVTKYLFDNVGNETSIRNISNYLKSQKSNVSAPTISNYIDGLIDSYMIYKCNKYDIKGKGYLETNAKYYIVDAGLRNALISNKNMDMGHTLENIVYLELLRRGYTVYVGKLSFKKNGNRRTVEVDFVAEKPDATREYYQVALYALEPTTLARELAPLKAIDDNYPKYLLSMDFGAGQTDGIKRINVLDWLMNNTENT